MTEEEENRTAGEEPLNCGGMTETNKRQLHHGLFELFKINVYFSLSMSQIMFLNHNLDYKLSTNHENTHSSF